MQAQGSLRASVTPDQPQHAGFAAVPAYPGGSFTVCLLNASNPKYCIQSNGVSQPVTITTNSGNWSKFTKQIVSVGAETFNFENGNGNCLRENTSHQVVIANGPCVSSDQDAIWIWPLNAQTQNYTGVWKNEQYTGEQMLVHGKQDQFKVLAGTPASGDYAKWAPPG